MKKFILLLLTICFSISGFAQEIDRKKVVQRNNPHITSIDSLGSLTVGNGHFAYTVDFTGVQSFPDIYKNGVPLCTMSDWGWHSFPNEEDYKAEEVLLNHDFHRGHQQELYSAEFKQEGRLKEATKFLRANPHRLNLAAIGFALDRNKISNISQTLDMWTGIIHSQFDHDGFRYTVETVCHPYRDLIGIHAMRKQIAPKAHDYGMELIMSYPYPTGEHSDDASNWQKSNLTKEKFTPIGDHQRLFHINIDSTNYYIDLKWKTKPSDTDWKWQARRRKHTIPCGMIYYVNDVFFKKEAEFIIELSSEENQRKGLKNLSFEDIQKASANYWEAYWNKGGMVDFSQVKDPRAQELERRTIQSLYLMAVNDGQDYPPAETGLTYNSWFGKYHLEMIYWHQAYQALWGHGETLEHTLSWYLKAEPMAREIAQRQGFKGIRWMKMTDPSAAEAPSNVGSYLIWQQPHLIYLAELLYRSDSVMARKVLDKYGRLVEETAEFMYDFAEYDSTRQQYILRGYIPAQETLKADDVINSPFELNYWLTAMEMAQQWRVRKGISRHPQWDDLIAKLAPLPSKEGIYLTSEKSPLIAHRAEQTDSPTGDDKFASDHPMPLGAFGMLPDSRLFTKDNMKQTYDWTIKNWNWQKTWGWDYPMTAMCAVRLGNPEDAINALLMSVPKNTYLVQGHNWQSNRLRCYLPGNGGLLTTIALMTAGWDGNKNPNPGFPKDWKVKWEGIKALP